VPEWWIGLFFDGRREDETPKVFCFLRENDLAEFHGALTVPQYRKDCWDCRHCVQVFSLNVQVQEEAERLLQEMPSRTTQDYNTLLAAHAKCGNTRQEESLLRDMVSSRSEDVAPDIVSYNFLFYMGQE
jgi:NAD-dependent dihydropyrimidine dehydrogenase PreA subunit